MRQFKCDFEPCGEVTFDAQVELRGLKGTSGGILLPDKYHVKHFCRPACFWEWVSKNKPEGSKKESGI